MEDLPELTPEGFEILVVRELRKAQLNVSALRLHRCITLPEREREYLLELAGGLSRGPWQRQALIACRRQEAPIGRGDVASLLDHLKEADAQAGILFGATEFTSEALQAAGQGGVVLLRVAHGRTAFDTSGWGTPGHYPAWLPAYCAQTVGRDVLGQVRYQLLDAGQGDVIMNQLQGPPPP
jgi:hypothetical protein